MTNFFLASVASWFQWALPFEMVWMFGLALVVSSLGFYRLVYFVSLGYAFSITAMAVVSMVLFREHLTFLSALHCLLLGLYGIRLGSFLVLRELQPSYQKELVEVQKRAEGIHLPKQFLIWVGVSLLYVWMFSPGLFHLVWQKKGGQSFSIFLVLGMLIMILGLLTETWADRQKSQFKKENPSAFCNVGMYKVVRCPNYLGEIVFWVGSWIAGISFYSSFWHLLVASLGTICIFLIMMGSTKRLEAKQKERYGEDPAFQKYTQTVPVLFPGTRQYSLQNIKVYLE